MFAVKLLALSILSWNHVLASPQVRTKSGVVEGTTCGNALTQVYRGIPFAKPPTGNLRFMAPQPFDSQYTGGVLNATQFAPTCIQIPGEFAWTKPSESEDCLYLDVYTPPGNLSNLPVKVWAHGGGNTGGSSSYPLYDLCNFATDSVAVSINYRLGPFGFLGLNAAGVEGNMGIKDYVMALEWVQENIASFGGDPRKVMLFGQSSGADDTFIVSTLPQAKSLINSAICESGGGATLPPYETIQIVGAGYAATLNCTSSSLSCLQAKSTDDLVAAYANLPLLTEGIGTFPYAGLGSWEIQFPNSTSLSIAFVDGKFITQDPLVVGPQVPIVMGSNGNDASLFTLPPLFLSGGPITEDNYTTFISQFGTAASKVAERYPLSAFNSSGKTENAVIGAITYIQTESDYTCNTYRGLRSTKRSGVPAYAYIFNHTDSCPWLWFQGTPFPSGGELPVFGATHSAELPLVLGNLDNQPWGNGTCNASQVDQSLSTSLQAMWTAMAASANPSISNFTWPQYDACTNQGLYVGNSTVVQPLDFSACAFWDEIWSFLGAETFSAPVCSSNGTVPTNGTGSPQPYTSNAVSIQRVTRTTVVTSIAFAAYLFWVL